MLVCRSKLTRWASFVFCCFRLGHKTNQLSVKTATSYSAVLSNISSKLQFAILIVFLSPSRKLRFSEIFPRERLSFCVCWCRLQSASARAFWYKHHIHEHNTTPQYIVFQSLLLFIRDPENGLHYWKTLHYQEANSDQMEPLSDYIYMLISIPFLGLQGSWFRSLGPYLVLGYRRTHPYTRLYWVPFCFNLRWMGPTILFHTYLCLYQFMNRISWQLLAFHQLTLEYRY